MPKLEWTAGPVTLRPAGFFDWIGEVRSLPTSDTVWTHLGRIPTQDGEPEEVGSVGHSRGSLKATGRLGALATTGYYEFDFMDPNRRDIFRRRQAWGEIGAQGWRLLAGQAWSLLRPNRHGLASDHGMMNTDVIEPAYHVGIGGNRRQQIRLTKEGSTWGTALAFERRTERTGGDVTWKLYHESGGRHLEAIALAGGGGRTGFSFAGVVPITKSVRFVTQQYVSRHAIAEALSLMPAGASGASFIQGIEASITKNVEVYSYGGLVYGSRSNGNRLSREWTIGTIRRMPAPGNYGSFITGMQLSQVDRQLWRGGSGMMTYLQVQFRYTFW